MSGVRVDTASPVPPYEQIRAQLAEFIHSGQLAAGDRLPSVRQLAADLGLANGTVVRAYRELESAGLVHSRRGAGTKVAALPHPTAAYTADRLADHARAYATAARRLGAGPADALEAVRRALTDG
ncbi:GntR family transcriptional regulator [Streptomyces sp. NPDC048389]|uniref:GntR family transcriptional regulator n=1 Tax=Streptomyces sp. NPDC048389 TaxID=3154622 RepID=UPI003453A494